MTRHNAQQNASTTTLNGLHVNELQGVAQSLDVAPQTACASFATRTVWTGGVTTRTQVSHWELGGERMERRFELYSDEPPELFGQGQAPNPQEMLLGAVASCMAVAYAVNATGMGIRIDDLEIQLSGTLDLRGAMDLVEGLRRGFPDVACRVLIRADADADQLAALHDSQQALA